MVQPAGGVPQYGMPQSRPGQPQMPSPGPQYDPGQESFRLPENVQEPNFEEQAWQELVARSQERGVRLPRTGTPEDWERFMNEFWERGGDDTDGQLLDYFSKRQGVRTPWHRDFSAPPGKELQMDQELGPSGRPRPRPYRPRERLFCPEPMS